jgi:NAD(P)-dependent dehydrogenase (short-subunit alcohol dehydrogenase family)
MNKTVVITGGGRGLGKAMANIFLEKGFQVVVADIIFQSSDSNNSPNYIEIVADVRSEQSMKQCVSAIVEKFGRVDLVISNAGIFDFYPLSEAGSEKLQQIFDVNFFGLAYVAKHFFHLLSESKGRFITISSESYKIPAPFQPYAVSKQAMEKLHFAIACEMKLKGVMSVLIRPGAMQTKIIEDTLQFKNSLYADYLDKEFTIFLKAVPKYISKVLPPELVAKQVYLASIAKNPRRTYNINHNPLVTLLSVLPSNVQDWLVAKQLK